MLELLLWAAFPCCSPWIRRDLALSSGMPAVLQMSVQRVCTHTWYLDHGIQPLANTDMGLLPAPLGCCRCPAPPAQERTFSLCPNCDLRLLPLVPSPSGMPLQGTLPKSPVHWHFPEAPKDTMPPVLLAGNNRALLRQQEQRWGPRGR